MDLGIAGKRAVVTGASSGLGLAIARQFVEEGVNVVLVARSGEKLAHARGQVSTSGPGIVEVMPANMVHAADVARASQWVSETGGVDILVVNVPRPPSPMRDFLDEDDDERWEAARRDQLDSGLLILRHFAPLMTDRGWGRIIGITSASVKEPLPRHAISTIFRAGLQAALKHLSHELGPNGITVNSVAPATVVTPTFASFHDLERRVSETALKRGGEMSELAGTVAFLASQQAGFVTGQNIQFDGGRSRSLV